jgi:hypothetical protein
MESEPELAPELFARKSFFDGLHQSTLARASDECLPLSMEAFRCADLQGFRHPLCLAYKAKTNRCFARIMAPTFLERLELCEREYGEQGAPTKCAAFVRDLNKTVEFRMDQQVADITLTLLERQGALHCGIPNTSRTIQEYHLRVSCLAPVMCKPEHGVWILHFCIAVLSTDGIHTRLGRNVY